VKPLNPISSACLTFIQLSFCLFGIKSGSLPIKLSGFFSPPLPSKKLARENNNNNKANVSGVWPVERGKGGRKRGRERGREKGEGKEDERDRVNQELTPLAISRYF
jgi:hypothetical protein